MNRKKIKVEKNTQNDKDQDQSQEVLVLSPNILEKLGINLGKMCVNQGFSVDTSEDIQNSKYNTLRNEEIIIKQENNSHMANDSKNTNEVSSIIETAKLMKKSVFLSPTFNTSQAVVLSNNLDLDNTKEPDKIYTENFYQDVEPDKNVNIHYKRDVHGVVTDIDNKNLSNLKLCSDLNAKPPHRDIHQTENCTFEKNNYKTKDKINKLSKESKKHNTSKPLIIFHDQQDLIPVPINTFMTINKFTNAEKKSINNNTCLPVDKGVTSTNEDTDNDEVHTSNQTNLNEEILITNSPESEINFSKNTTTPHEKSPEVIFDTADNIISSDIISTDVSEISAKHVKHSMPIETDFISEIKATNISVDEVKKCEFSGSETSKKIHQTITQENILCSKSVNNQINNISINNSQLDSIKTIANILSQHVNKDKPDKPNIKNFEKFHSQEFFYTLKQNKVKSKLSVQGVEKPGGEDKIYRFQEPNIKTYARKKKAGLPKRPKHVMNDYNVESIVTMDIDYKIEVDYSNIQYPRQFCICSDFGRLHNYTLGENYKHLHFWKTENNSSYKIMFSIYDDNENHSINCGDNTDLDSIDFEETRDSECNICYNVTQLDLGSKIEEDIQFTNAYENKSTNANKVPESQISSNINKTSKKICNDVIKLFEDESKVSTKKHKDSKMKRKICLTKTSEEITYGLSCKKPTKAVTCHVCHETLSETELENHVTSMHKIINDRNINKSLSDIRPSEPVVREVPILEHQPKAKINASDVTCAVCGMNVPNDQWLDHLAREHSYLAWQEGLAPLDPTDEIAVREHLVNICKKTGELTCSNCFAGQKNVDSYLAHISKCGSTVCDILNNISSVAATSSDNEPEHQTCSVKCAVCEQELPDEQWQDHIATEHNYLAWKVGESILDLNDDDAVYDHLYLISKEIGGLKCRKCDCRRKYVKLYLQHIKTCDGPLNVTVTSSVNDTLKQSGVAEDSFDDDAGEGGEVACGVCGARVRRFDWLQHAQLQHAYMAWQEGHKPLDPTDAIAVREHLVNICNKTGELSCSNCFAGQKNVDSYLAHISKCGSTVCDILNNISSVAATSSDNEPEHQTCSVKCAVCKQELPDEQWMDHIATEHNYLAWKDGESILDLNDDDAVYDHLYLISKEIGGLKCRKCDCRRKYVKLYLQHIKTCDGPLNVTVTSSVNDTLNQSGIAEDSSDDDAGEGGEVACGVCGARVRRFDWLQHAQLQHAYMTWREGHKPLDISDEDAVYSHLRKILKKAGELVCRVCNKKRKYVKSYLHHVEKCNELGGDTQAVKCGVCEKEVIGFQWIQHIAEEHNYIGWKDGQTPLDPTDSSAVHEHLVNICDKLGELTCSNCLAQKKSVDSYLRHFKDCGKMDTPKNIENITDNINNDNAQIKKSCNVKCAVCDRELPDKQWMGHIATEHNYLAWKVGEPKLDLDDDEAVYNHLNGISKDFGELKCSKCGVRRKYVKSYLRHVQACDGSNGQPITNTSCLAENGSDDDVVVGGTEEGEVTCGVCSARVRCCDWQEHAQRQHAYLAWREGHKPLDVSNEKAVYMHLHKILRKAGDLICGTCNERRRYVKSYILHVAKCDESNEIFKSLKIGDNMNQSAVSEVNSTLDGATVEDGSDDAGGSGQGDEVTCGVCAERVRRCDWMTHAQRQHAYLAWRRGEAPLNLEDSEEVYEHLYKINRNQNGLKCNKCDVKRKYVKAYLSHVASCDTVTARTLLENGDLDVYECAICSAKVNPTQWTSHAMEKHYNVAWIVGESPIDIKNPFAVEKYLKEYKKRKHDKLECMACGLVRVSYAGFYAHIIQCGKTEEETEMYKNMCDICNNTYLCIYKNQHMTMHREQENSKNRKLMLAEKGNVVDPEPEEGIRKRKAAEKAKTVIETLNDATHKCPTCGFGADDEKELKEHVCKQESVSDEDASADFDSASSDDDSFDSDMESDHSNNELVVDRMKKKKKHGDTIAAKITRIPFKVNKPKAYIMESAEDFFNMYFTSDVLFPKWRTCANEPVSDDQLAQYMPLVQQSCKVMFDSDEWTTYYQFEAKVRRDVSVFVGGSIQCMSWAPPNMTDRESRFGNFLVVACHRDSDTPRFEVDETYTHSNMLQIWDFEDLQKSPPKFVMGIAHDLGTVWAMDWCPSGARDVLLESRSDWLRLGLLAVACSSGSAYIFSVPYPSTIKKDNKLLYKLKPVAELRFSRGGREIYQATSVTWSLEKGHSSIIVGYADGRIGSYNVDLESPLLTEEEDGITIYYPYDEEQRHNSSITDLSTLPSGAGGTACVSSASQTGAAMTLRGASVRSLLPATRAGFLPHWPAVMMAGNDTIVTQAVNELDCFGAGRRLGSLQCWGGCWHCGTAAASSPPALRLLYAHPAHNDILRKDLAMIQMRPLDNKTRKIKNDGLAVKIEPTTFEDAVKSYGLEFKFLTGNAKDNLHQVMTNKEQCPERFPLADVTSMAFCPSAIHHRKLAVATHSGIIFLITV